MKAFVNSFFVSYLVSSLCFVFCLWKPSDAEFMQYRFPVGAGPSSKRCPRWAPQCLQTTSLRVIPSDLSTRISTASFSAVVKLGQPVPESNLSLDRNSTAPQLLHL